MKRGKILLISLLGLASLFFVSGVRADSPSSPSDYTVVSGNGQYILVMLADNAKGAYNQRGHTIPEASIRAKYSQAGLFKNDGSTTPLWTVDWYSFSVELSSDGQHLVQYGPWAWSDNYDELALAFHENGKLLTGYSVSDLVANPSDLPHTVSHYFWLKDASFDDARSELLIETHTGEKYVFDVRTGQVISGSTPPGVISSPTSPGVIGGATPPDEQGSIILGPAVAFAVFIVLLAALFILRTKRHGIKRSV